MKIAKRLMIIGLAFALVTTTATAQDFTSKKGKPILPEAKDWSIGFNAVPVVAFFGNLLYNSGGGSSAAPLGYNAPLTLTGKYMLDANTALRIKFGVNVTSTSLQNYVINDTSTLTGIKKPVVEDEQKVNSTSVMLGAGYQKYKGKGRVKGFYGAELGIGIGGGKTTYSYGNDYSNVNTDPTSTIDFNTGATNDTSDRITKISLGSTFMIGLRGFVGIEYFIAAKISLSAEYGWGLLYNSTADGKIKREELDAGNNEGLEREQSTGGNSSTSVANDIGNGFLTGGGAINLHFYF